MIPRDGTARDWVVQVYRTGQGWTNGIRWTCMTPDQAIQITASVARDGRKLRLRTLTEVERSRDWGRREQL